MKKFIALGAVLAVLAVAAATASAGSNPNTLTLAVYGDSPYWDTTPAFVSKRTAEFDATPAFINTINADLSVQEVVHVGDIHYGSEACTVASDDAIFKLWTGSTEPL